MFISNFYGFVLDEFGMLSRRAGFSATAELSCTLSASVEKNVSIIVIILFNNKVKHILMISEFKMLYSWTIGCIKENAILVHVDLKI